MSDRKKMLADLQRAYRMACNTDPDGFVQFMDDHGEKLTALLTELDALKSTRHAHGTGGQMKDKDRAKRYAAHKLTGFAKRRAYEGYLAGLRMGRKLERGVTSSGRHPSPGDTESV